MKPVLLALAVVMTLGLCAGNASADVVLYDVDFGSPHTPDAPPVVGFGATPRRTPSSQRLTTVESPVGPLGGPALSLAPKAATTSAVSFWLGSGSDPRSGDPGLGVQFPTYLIEMDVAVLGLVESPPPGDNPEFRIELEAPFAHQLRFTHDGVMRAITFDDNGITETRIGASPFGQPMHLRLLAELTAHRWSIDVGGAQAFTGVFPNEGSLWSLNAVLDRPSMIAAAGIDNVRVTGLPEPAVGVLVFVGFLMLRRSGWQPVGRA